LISDRRCGGFLSVSLVRSPRLIQRVRRPTYRAGGATLVVEEGAGEVWFLFIDRQSSAVFGA
jgi:hypothetical protein